VRLPSLATGMKLKLVLDGSKEAQQRFKPLVGLPWGRRPKSQIYAILTGATIRLTCTFLSDAPEIDWFSGPASHGQNERKQIGD